MKAGFPKLGPYVYICRQHPFSGYCYLVPQWCLILCDPMGCSTPGSPVLHYVPKFSQTHILWAWCHPAISSSVTLLSFCSQSFPASGSCRKCMCILPHKTIQINSLYKFIIHYILEVLNQYVKNIKSFPVYGTFPKLFIVSCYIGDNSNWIAFGIS